MRPVDPKLASFSTTGGVLPAEEKHAVKGAAAAPEAAAGTVASDQAEISAEALRAAQRRLDSVKASIEGAVEAVQADGAGGARGGAVGTYTARAGALLLSTAGNNLNLGGVGASDGALQVFRLRISGVAGGLELSFASGTTLTSVRDAINYYAGKTGVNAEYEPGRGLLFRGPADSANAFVSVSIIDDGHAVGLGVRQVRQ